MKNQINPPSEALRNCIAKMLTLVHSKPVSCDDEIVYRHLNAVKPIPEPNIYLLERKQVARTL